MSPGRGEAHVWPTLKDRHWDVTIWSGIGVPAGADVTRRDSVASIVCRYPAVFRAFPTFWSALVFDNSTFGKIQCCCMKPDTVIRLLQPLAQPTIQCVSIKCSDLDIDPLWCHGGGHYFPDTPARLVERAAARGLQKDWLMDWFC